VAAAAGRTTGGRSPTAGTGGRIVSLTDGREYVVGQSLVFGRDASCEVVITSKDVSRRHAEIMPTAQGYVIVDSSTNGTFVNGQRVHGQVLLSRADVVRIGDNDFRFYADVAAAARAPAPTAAPPPEPSQGAARRLANTLFGQRPPVAGPATPATPATPAAASPPTPPTASGPDATMAPPTPPAAPAAKPAGRPSGAELAHLVIRSGTLKGQRLPVRTTLANIGRADYNDIILPDDSVSTVHAKLQRREGIWVIVDLGSTNGTFADGDLVATEAPLAPGALLRFGEVRAFFEPADEDEPVQGGSTKVLQAIRLPPESQ